MGDRRAGFAVSRNAQTTDLLRRHEKEVSTLANLSSFTVCEKDKNTLRIKNLVTCSNISDILGLKLCFQVLSENDAAPAGCAVSVVNQSLCVYLKLQGAIDVKKEREKLNTKLTDLQK